MLLHLALHHPGPRGDGGKGAVRESLWVCRLCGARGPGLPLRVLVQKHAPADLRCLSGRAEGDLHLGSACCFLQGPQRLWPPMAGFLVSAVFGNGLSSCELHPSSIPTVFSDLAVAPLICNGPLSPFNRCSLGFYVRFDFMN